jgi:hypothetical protein
MLLVSEDWICGRGVRNLQCMKKVHPVSSLPPDLSASWIIHVGKTSILITDENLNSIFHINKEPF